MASDPQPQDDGQQDGRPGRFRRFLKAVWALGSIDGPRPDLSAEIKALGDHASQKLEEDVQRQIAELIPLAYRICELRTTYTDQLVSMFRSIVPMITAEQPNLTVCRRMYVETALLANWQRSWGMRLIYMVGRGRPGSAALAGMIWALLLAMVAAWMILSQFEPDNASPPIDPPDPVTESEEAEEGPTGPEDEPSRADYSFSVPEHADPGEVVGPLESKATDTEPVYTIIEGNEDGAFDVNHSDGMLIVTNGSLLDHETEPVRRLTLEVAGAGSPLTETVNVFVTDANDPPTMVHQIFVVSEHAAASTEVGTLTAEDQDEGEVLSYAITAGNEGGAFDVNLETGRLRVVQPSSLNYDRVPTLTLKIEVSDDDGAIGVGTVSVHVTPGQEDPLTPYDRKDVFALLMSAFLGSLASIVVSLTVTPEPTNSQPYDPATVFIRAFFKPLVAMIFSLAVFSVLKTELVTISGLSVSQGGEIQFHMLWVIGFLSGFSERFAPRIFGQVSGDGQRSGS